MQQESTYSISFYSTGLNQTKYNMLYAKAVKIRDFKNELSKLLCADPVLIQNFSKFNFFKKYNTQIDGLVGRELQPALSDVYTKYQNKFNQLNSKISFKVQSKINITYYKKDTKKNKKSDVKDFIICWKSTKLTKIATFLAKYYNEGLIEYMINEIERNIKSKEQIQVYKDALFYIDKYGVRLINLVISRKQQLIKKLFSIPILFKSLTYSAVNTAPHNVSENKNNNSIMRHFICLSGFRDIVKNGRLLYIPININKQYHGNIKDFNRTQSCTIQFIKNKVRIILTKKGIRNSVTDCDKIIGVDTNIKHNLFSLSNNETIDFNRDLIRNYIKTQLKYDKKLNFLYKSNDEDLTEKEIKQKYKIIARQQKWTRRLIWEQNYNVHQLIKSVKVNGFNHIVCEGLEMKDKVWCRSEEFFNVKYSRLSKILHLSNMKNILRNQCMNKGIQLSIVPSHYTSQRCSKCGYVDKRNRKTQEDFLCLECGYKENADFNASQNIKQYLEIDVLFRSFLKQESNGWYVLKKLGKETIKKVLVDYYETKYSNNTEAIQLE
jgi:putative transposase